MKNRPGNKTDTYNTFRLIIRDIHEIAFFLSNGKIYAEVLEQQDMCIEWSQISEGTPTRKLNWLKTLVEEDFAAYERRSDQ